MKLTMEDHGSRIRESLEKGWSYRQIAADLGCSKDTVSIFAKVNFPELRRVPSSAQPPPESVSYVSASPLKLLIIDIETRPSLAYVWDVWQQNIHPRQIVEEKEVISFAAKWLNSEDVMFSSVFHDGKQAMLEAAWHLLDEADAVIHYNGKKFDIPHLNMEFLRNGFKPPSSFRQIDLLMTVRSEFNFTHNKLDNVASKLGIGSKIEHEGFDLWLKCMSNDADAWDRMREYNIHDAELTEELYLKVLPWIKSHPSLAAATRERVCPNCGSEDLQSKGRTYTKTGVYQRYVCGNCGKSSRERKREASTEITETASW